MNDEDKKVVEEAIKCNEKMMNNIAEVYSYLKLMKGEYEILLKYLNDTEVEEGGIAYA